MRKLIMWEISLLVMLLSMVAPAKTINWQSDWDKAWEQAKHEKKPVLVAINMDRADTNDGMLRVYRDKKLVQKSGHAVAVICNNSEHYSPEDVCSRFGKNTCNDHILCDAKMRIWLEKQKIIKNKTDSLFAPQHFLIDPVDNTIFWQQKSSVSAKTLASEIVKARTKMHRKWDRK